MFNLELRNVKHMLSLSRESFCFTAELWLNGKKAGTVENKGSGGQNNIQPRDLEAQIEAHAITLPDRDDLSMSADYLISCMMTDWLLMKDMQKALRKRVLYTRHNNNNIFQTSVIAAADLPAAIARYKNNKAVAQVLNSMPEAEAFKLYAKGGSE